MYFGIQTTFIIKYFKLAMMPQIMVIQFGIWHFAIFYHR